jgi:hypothetical protein
MKIDSSLMSKLPGYHVGLGAAFFAFAGIAKANLPQAIGSLPIIQLPCAFFSAVMIPFGSLLALRALLLQSTSRRSLLSCHLLGLVFVLVMLVFYFYAFVTMNRILDLVSHPPSLLPKLTENARSFPDEQKRIVQAQWAYRLYGVIVAYRLDNLGVNYYVPSEEDKTYWRKQELTDANSKTKIAFIMKVTNQYPYLFGLYAATYLATFTVGWIWLLVKVPKELPDAAA